MANPEVGDFKLKDESSPTLEGLKLGLHSAEVALAVLIPEALQISPALVKYLDAHGSDRN